MRMVAKVKETFGQKLKQLRQAKNWSQSDLAEAYKKVDVTHRGINLTYMSKIENDKLPPPSDLRIRTLAKAFDVDADELLVIADRLPLEARALLKKSAGARRFLIQAIRLNLAENEEFWKHLCKKYTEGNSRRVPVSEG